MSHGINRIRAALLAMPLNRSERSAQPALGERSEGVRETAMTVWVTE